MQLLFGDPNRLAIFSNVTKFCGSVSQRALGSFNLFVGGVRYGVDAPDATMLACSYEEVLKRIADRGEHVAPFAEHANGVELIRACYRAAYKEDGNLPNTDFTPDEICDWIYTLHLFWAPDGDEAFDDSSYVLHFDVEDHCRVVACTIGSDAEPIPETIRDVWLPASEFYALLQQWSDAFIAGWAKAKASL